MQPVAVPADFEALVQSHLDGFASDDEIARLEDNEAAWAQALRRLLARTDAALDEVRRDLSGQERALVVADFEQERARIVEVLEDLVGPLEPPAPEPSPEQAKPDGQAGGGAKQDKQESRTDAVPGVAALQLSWLPGRLVVWCAGPGADAVAADDVLARLKAAGGGAIPWEPFRQVPLPDGGRADAVSAPISASLGWLAAAAGSAQDADVGASLGWMAVAAARAITLVAQGRMVPQLRRTAVGPDGRKPKGERIPFEVTWAPALLQPRELDELQRTLPGAVTALRDKKEPREFSLAVLGDLVDAICRSAAARVEVPAVPADVHSRSAAAEAILAKLDGTPFQAPHAAGAELIRRLEQWATPVSPVHRHRLTVQLDAPDDIGAWHLRVLATGDRNRPDAVRRVIAGSSRARAKELEAELVRLERSFPALLRPGEHHRGEVVLSQDEAWQLMTTTGAALRASGFDVQVPALSRKRPTPSLRLTSLTDETSVGARQLADVRWSAVFDDVELTAEEIRKLAREARPLIRARGRWVEVDKADLAQAAAALEERASKTQLSGADMLRHALGLEGTPLAGGITLAGEGWANDLLRSAASVSEHRPEAPEGFKGTLRTYQAEALGWLQFLHGAGLGGCLALDMGLGKTPTLLAHLCAIADTGPALVIAPPAVVGNWAAEARRFTPGLKVVVHHGAGRADEDDIPTMAASANVVITSYGTAVRDIDSLEGVRWGAVVLDEAQVIKNPASDTAQQLRRLDAATRLALTGTPIENGLGDLWAILDFTNPGLVGARAPFVANLSEKGNGGDGAEKALRALNGILVFRRTKAEPAIAAELPDRVDELDHCAMTPEQIGLYQAVLDQLVVTAAEGDDAKKKGAVLAAITALKQICNHPAAYRDDDRPLDGRSGKLARLNEIVDNVFAAGERVLIFTHFASWGEKLAAYLSERTGVEIPCYRGGLSRTARDKMVAEFQAGTGAGAMVLSLKAGGTGLNLTSASHVVLYDRWWNPAVEDQARDRVWRIGQKSTVICHRLVCPGTVDERVEEVVAGKRRIANLVLPKSSSIEDLDVAQLTQALGLDPDAMLTEELDADGSEVAA